jgi:aspartyl-tRNA(Asn)/glutamyl-tRNA(Gln) amidotransferase subunit A
MYEAASSLRARKVSSVELTRAAIARIEALDGTLVAFIARTLDSAGDDAKRADDELAAGTDRGPFHGIPVALKDLYDMAGVATTAGSRIFVDNVAKTDSAVTARLRAGGAVLLGKTNLHEWAYGVTNQNPHFGHAKNPWDTTRIPGGSSGGSAIAVATGMVALSPGSDTGGSIRIPAALCGIAGLKPTYGRISLRGVVPLAWSLDHAGPLARTVRDLAIALAQLAGYDAADPTSADVPVDDYLADLEGGTRGLRVLIPTNHFFNTVDPEVDAAVREAARTLASLGAGGGASPPTHRAARGAGPDHPVRSRGVPPRSHPRTPVGHRSGRARASAPRGEGDLDRPGPRVARSRHRASRVVRAPAGGRRDPHAHDAHRRART